MLNFKNSLMIERPAAEVFQFVANFENMPKWNYFVTDVKKISSGPIVEGTTYHQVRKTDEQRYEIVEYELNRRVAVKTIQPAPALLMRFTFEARGDHTLLTDEWELETSYPGLIERVASFRVKAAIRENLSHLKQLLETGRTQLQDGRLAVL